MSETQKINFPSFMREDFEKTLEKVNKKLGKIKGTSDVTILEESEFKKSTNHGTFEFTEVTFEMPVSVKHRGFEFVGTVSVKDGVKTIFAPSGENVADVDQMVCDHCKHNRRRNHVHVFNHTKKGRFVIGSKCVEEYFGVAVFKALTIFKGFFDTVNSFKDDEDEYFRGARGTYGFDRAEVFGAVRVQYSRSDKYSKGDYYGGVNSTAQDVKDILASRIPQESGKNDIGLDNKQLDKLLKDTYGSLDPKTSNFNSNVVESLFSNGELRDFVPLKVVGIFAWAIFNAVSKKEKANAPKAVNAHIGKLGEKTTISDATVKSFKEMGSFSYNGPSSFLITFETPTGVVKTFSTNGDLTGLDIGDTVVLEGKVKKHESWKGYKSTMLNYTKIAPTATEKKEAVKNSARAVESKKKKDAIRKIVRTAYKLPTGKELPELAVPYVRTIDNPNFTPRAYEDTVTNKFKSEHRGYKLSMTKRNNGYYYVTLTGGAKDLSGMAFNASTERSYLNFKRKVMSILAVSMGYDRNEV